MALKIKPAGKILIIAAVIAVGIFGVRWYQNRPKDVNGSIESSPARCAGRFFTR
jgi:hypothetical protein